MRSYQLSSETSLIQTQLCLEIASITSWALREIEEVQTSAHRETQIWFEMHTLSRLTGVVLLLPYQEDHNRPSSVLRREIQKTMLNSAFASHCHLGLCMLWIVSTPFMVNLR